MESQFTPLLFALLSLTCLPSTIFAQDRIPPLYQFRDIPVPANYNPGREQVPHDINDSGQVSGEVGLLDDPEIDEEPFALGYRWDSRSNALILIKNLWQRGVTFPEPRGFDNPHGAVSQPFDINSKGNMAVLDWLDDDQQGFFWSDFDGDGEDDEAILLPTFDFRNNNWARNGRANIKGLNDFDQVVGTSDVANPDGSRGGQHAFIWEDSNGNRVAEDEEMINLGVFGTDKSSRGVRINNNGMIMAIGTRSSGGLRGLIIEPDHEQDFQAPVFTDIGTLGEPRITPLDLNENGVVVGEALSSADNQNHGFVWDKLNGIRDLNNLPLEGLEAGWLIATARAINDHQVIVGNFVDNDNNFRVYVLDLDALEFAPLDTLFDIPANVSRFGVVKGINNLNQIVGVYFPVDTWIRSYLLTPIEDSDGDGLVDFWERVHFETIDAYDGSDDPDEDGLLNALEIAMDLNPLDFDGVSTVFRIVPENGDEWITFTFRRSTMPNAPGLQLQEHPALPEDPADWTDITPDGIDVIEEIADEDPDGDGSSQSVRIRRRLGAGEDSLFMRLRTTDGF